MGVLYYIKVATVLKGSGVLAIGLVVGVFLLEGFVDMFRQAFSLRALLVVIEKHIDILSAAAAVYMGHDQALVLPTMLSV